MTEAPLDIRKTAYIAATDITHKLHQLGWTNIAHGVIDGIIAKRLLDERERCCKVAAHFTGTVWTPDQNIVAQMILDELRNRGLSVSP